MTTENNKIIAEFMGRVIPEDKLEFYDENPTTHYYHSNWNWLMEVVEKIEETEVDNNILMLESIGNMAKFIFDDGCRFLNDCIGETKIEAVYNAVVEVINWYNSAKKNKTV